MSYYGSTEPQQTQAPSGLCPEGEYQGVYIKHTCTASAQKGTPCIEVDFDVQGHIKTVQMYITEATLTGMTGDQLAHLGCSGEYPDVTFNPPEVVSLYVKHEEYKGRWRERWNVSLPRAASEGSATAAARAMKLWAARRGAQPAPTGRPVTPTIAAPSPKPPALRAAVAPPPPAAPAPPPPAPKHDLAAVIDANSAYAAIAHVDPDGTKFWAAVAAARDGSEGTPQEIATKLTPAEWQRIVTEIHPF